MFGRRYSRIGDGPRVPLRLSMLEALERRALLCSEHLIDSVGMTFYGNGLATVVDVPTAPGLGAAMRADAAAGPAAAPGSAGGDDVAPSGLPLLNSLPGAPTSIYLDFDGYTTEDSDQTPYDTDGNPSTFTASEQADIREAWRHVASYFAMFYTNVTTVQPADDLAYSYSVIANNHQGTGFSYMRFPTTDPSAYNPSADVRTRRSGLAHEIGHNFGLQHQSDYDALGQKVYEYTYGYDSLHGAIMGVDYAQSVHKWFIGHPTDSPAFLQDDVAQIAAKIKRYTRGGDGMRPDDYPGTAATPLAETSTAGVFAVSGVIERLTDVDRFSFASLGGPARIDVVPPDPSMLDAKLELYAPSGKLIAAADGAANDQHLAVPYLAAGTYTVMVRSHGDYADLGQYDLTVHTSAGDAPVATYNALPAPDRVTSRPVEGPGVAVSWGAVAGASGYLVERSSDGESWAAVASLGAGSTSLTDSGLDGGRRYFYRVSALDSTGASQPSGVVITITRPDAAPTLSLTSWLTGVVVLNWRDVSGESGYRVERQTDAAGDTWSTVAVVDANVPSVTAGGLVPGTSYRFRVTPFSSQGDGRSVEVEGTTRLPAVTGLAFTAKRSDRFAIQWDDSPYASSYRVQRSNNGSDFSTIATLPAGSTSYEDTAVFPLREYYYRVVPVNETAQGLPGDVVFAAAPAPADQALPAPWAQRDIGPVGGSGTTGFNASTGTFNVIAGGQDITDAADAFHFTYQPLVGDGEITARLAAQEPTDEWAKAGVMVRESLSSGSRHAMMVISPDHGTTFQWRGSTGGGSKKLNTEGAYAPYWVRLVRQGDTLTGYRSADGVNWAEQGSATIDMARAVFVGLAAVPGNNAKLATVAFTNVSVSNFRPTVAIPASASSATVAGQVVSLWALGADDHGESNLRYDWAAVRSPRGAPAPRFSDGGTNVAKNVTATFFRAGAYLLRVRMTDASGLAVTSAVTVQVVATPTALRVTPAVGPVRAAASRRFGADVLDQFGQVMAPAPALTWYATAGSVDAAGVYTAPRAAGQYLVGAEFGALSAYVPVTVVDSSRRTAPRSAYLLAQTPPST